MDIGKISERFMGMDDATWARHSNPLSGWSRVSILPLMALAVWSRVWLGWDCLWLIVIVALWTWYNPRLFKPPKSQSAWMTQGILGERIWLAQKQTPIAAHHVRITRILNLVSGIGLFILIIGLWRFDLGFTIAGLVLSMGAKLWFLDRMVWIKADTDKTID
ncbi:MAG: hypothetical protein P8P98_08855 [Emcibacteraceae bacterium]|nr:hypothetical protein [Emcibacteraceae bacterium]MDG1997456.1 hypothetical protein [Emcibacteraceae bacterium]